MKFCNGRMVTIKNGDTLYSLSMQHQVPLALLLRANPYVDVYNLQVGDTICIPMSGMEMNQEEESNQEARTATVEQRMPASEELPRNPVMPAPEELPRNPVMSAPEELSRTPVMPGMSNPVEEPAWNRYVTQPGDTLADLVGTSDSGQSAGAFIERNPLDKIHLLPGVAYYIKKQG